MDFIRFRGFAYVSTAKRWRWRYDAKHRNEFFLLSVYIIKEKKEGSVDFIKV